MTIFWLTLASVYMISFMSRYLSIPVINTPEFTRPNRILACFVIALLAVVSGLRRNIGDTYFYMLSYNIGDFRIQSIQFEGDFGFNILQACLHLFSDNPQVLIFTTALITNLLIVLVLYKYSKMIELAIFVYITSGMYFVSMNGIRQYLAAAIIFAATKYLLKGNFLKYAAIVLIASTIHQTGLILIPIYFVVRREAWTKVTIALLAAAVFLALGYQQLSDMLFSMIGDSKYGHYKDFAEGGSSILRVIVNCVPVVLAYLGRKRLRELWPQSDYIVNLSLLGSIFLVIATQNWIFARFNIYFGFYNLILISWIVKLFPDKKRKIIYYAVLTFYFLYFFYEQVISLGIVYRSNYFQF